MSNFKLLSLNMRMATDVDSHLPAYDHTKLSAINTCPTWGILRYSHHKKMPSSARSMALEAGSLAHEGFAAVRLFQYMEHEESCNLQTLDYHGIRLFGEDRYNRMRDTLSSTATERTNCINYTIECLESFGFYDDISDRNRTVSNITESMISYIDSYNMERYPLWIRDKDDPLTDIGIEIPFDIVVDIEYIDAYEHTEDNKKLQVRFTGKLDGLHYDKDKLIIVTAVLLICDRLYLQFLSKLPTISCNGIYS